MDAIKALLKQVTAYWTGKDKRFRRNVIIIACVLVAVIIFASVLLNHVDYAILYSGLDAQDSAAIISALADQKEPCKVDGSTISVPAADADKLRITLSSQISNGFNLDILNQGTGLGVTESQRQDYLRYQIQSDLQNSLRTLKGIKDAKVVLTMPTDSVLALDDNRQDATAGVILTLDSGYSLTSTQMKGIAEFVQKAVPGLKLDNISLMDSNSQILDFSGTDDSANASDRYALQANVEASLRKQVMALLMPIFGMGRVEAEVNVALDFDDRIVDTVTYSPVVNDRDGVIRSYQKLKEQIVNGSSAGGQPGTASNTGTAADSYPAVNVDNGTYEKNEDTVNYEVNQVNDHLQKEKGAIKTLSVSVVIDSTGLKDDFSDNVKNLVKNAVGATLENISVEYMPMKASQDQSAAAANDTARQAAQANAQQDLPFIVIGAVMLAVIAAMLLLLLGRRSRIKAAAGQQAAVPSEPMTEAEELEQMEQELETIKIVKDNSAKEQIGKLIENNPELVANLLRSWLADDQE
jgi:flagellar M-ring protein FliF